MTTQQALEIIKAPEHVKAARFDVAIVTPKKKLIDVKDISFDAAVAIVVDVMNNCNDEFLLDQLSSHLKSFGFMGYGGNGYDININAYVSREILKEKHTCGRRMDSQQNKDEWRKVGNDICCNYCGSASWETFMTAVDNVIARKEGWGIEYVASKGYKFYITNPTVPNAGFGAIKFYTHHLPTLSEDEMKAVDKKINEAMKISNENFQAKLKNMQL